MDRKLDHFRKEIDNVNVEILELLNKRTDLIKGICDLKDEFGMIYFDPKRESEMLEKILMNNNGPLHNGLVKDIFTAIFKSSLKFMGINQERKLIISSQRNEGFYTIQKMFDIPDDRPVIIAGPCSVEKSEYLEDVAALLVKYGIKFMRGGAFKPRTSPYDFQGLRKDGLKILNEVGHKFGLITVTEVVDTRDVEMVAEYVDVLQIGARNMFNYELLKEVGLQDKPVILKRGLSATMQEFMLAAEYIGMKGNRKIILCERGIRTFETKTRNTLDISVVPIVKKETSLPILIDLSHSLGRKDIIDNIAKAAIAVGADGLMVEVHPCPEVAFSDSNQQLNPSEFIKLLEVLNYKAMAESI